MDATAYPNEIPLWLNLPKNLLSELLSRELVWHGFFISLTAPAGPHLVLEEPPNTSQIPTDSPRVWLISSYYPGIPARNEHPSIKGLAHVQSGLEELVTVLRQAWQGQFSACSQCRKCIEEGHPLETLSDRERSVLNLLAQGQRNRDVADSLSLSPQTVSEYTRRILTKMKSPSLPALCRELLDDGYLKLLNF